MGWLSSWAFHTPNRRSDNYVGQILRRQILGPGYGMHTRYGKFCAQLKTLLDFAAPSTDEDCLYLNVFAPKAGNRNYPVMVWIHGGGSVGQSNGLDGSALAKEQNVIVVTLNFRIGALGALVHPALDGGGSTTLYTLRDQQFALQWVKDNIESFGGNPNNVTLLENPLAVSTFNCT